MKEQKEADPEIGDTLSRLFGPCTVARAMYKKHGYDEIGIVPTVFNGIPGINLVLLEKHLDL